MSKTMITWAVAALLAVPAVPIFAKTAVHASAIHKTHRTLVQHAGKKHRTLHHGKVAHKQLVSSHRAGKKLSSTVRHTARTSAAHPVTHLRTTPPTIDGMST